MSKRIAALLIAVVSAACGHVASLSPTAPSPASATPIMGAARLSAVQLSAWFTGRSPQPGGGYAASVSIAELTRYYIEEGAAEGVAGDVAFTQSVLETGWFRFGGVVPAAFNNFAGIGATDTDPSPARFPDARTGVRAQIQHLRAYADPTAITCAVPPLANPCVDPRFALVTPKGRARNWDDLGNGNWATSTTYATSILKLYDEARAFGPTR